MQRHRTSAIFLAAWVALIFGTSCTVVLPQEFFDLLHRHLITNIDAYEGFQAFWGIAWFTVVKGWHAAEFAILTFLCSRVFQWKTETTARGSVAAAMLCCALFAVSDEWHQSFVPDRMGTVTDVLIDCLGVLLMGLVQLRRSTSRGPRTDATHEESRLQ